MAKEVKRFNRRLAKLLHAGDDGVAALAAHCPRLEAIDLSW